MVADKPDGDSRTSTTNMTEYAGLPAGTGVVVKGAAVVVTVVVVVVVVGGVVGGGSVGANVKFVLKFVGKYDTDQVMPMKPTSTNHHSLVYWKINPLSGILGAELYWVKEMDFLNVVPLTHVEVMPTLLGISPREKAVIDAIDVVVLPEYPSGSTKDVAVVGVEIDCWAVSLQ